ncbi:hypothetical protein EVAR_37315_1 [Eumeta japonica]|uniref:Uncharacterized protein n=1 Tax=Eumeta variegata TaxID=151549 RepID=A0A4C1WZH4_EUMVA|nr:hypothetical protein EVAR_37315_1 [Eumeta japonica]
MPSAPWVPLTALSSTSRERPGPRLSVFNNDTQSGRGDLGQRLRLNGICEVIGRRGPNCLTRYLPMSLRGSHTATIHVDSRFIEKIVYSEPKSETDVDAAATTARGRGTALITTTNEDLQAASVYTSGTLSIGRLRSLL